MSNITRNYIVPAGLPYKVGVRSWGKEDLVRTLYGSVEEATISRDEMQNYVLDGITVTPVINDNKAIIDFSNVKLPWKFEHSDKLLTSRFAIAPLGTTVTQPKYVKDVNGTKVGSPTVDENYVVTNFSNSQYISTTPFTFNDTTDTFKVDTYVKLSSLSNYTFIFTASSTSRGAATQSSMWKTHSSNGNQTGGSVATNRWYHIVLEQTGDSSVLYVDGQAVINAGKCFNSGDYINFGKSYWEPFYNGFIDFSQTSIQINSVDVWSGTHWVDRVLNTNKIGNLTIDRDYVASGFSSNTSYAQIPVLLDFSKPWEMVIKHYYTGNGIQCFLTSPSTGSNEIPGFFQNGFSGWIDVNNNVNVRFSHDGVNGTTRNAGNISVNNSYYIRGRWDGTTYYAGCSTDGVNYTEISYESSLPLFNPTKLSTIGVHIYTTSWNLRGTVDLKECYFKSGNEYLWRGVEDLGTETLSGCIKSSSVNPGLYQVYAINGDESITLYKDDEKEIDPTSTNEKEWYLGNFEINL